MALKISVISRILKAGFVLFSFTVLPPVILWHVCYNLLAGYFLAVTWLALTYFLAKSQWRAALLLFLINGALYVLTSYFTLMEYQKRSAAMCARIDAGLPLSTQEKAGIYGLNILMGVAGYPFFPEASTETLLLCIPTDNQQRIFEDDFFLESQRIRRALRKGQSTVSWSLSDLSSFGSETRAGMALNPCTIQQKSNRIEVTVDVRYSRNFSVQLLGFITVEEKLFWYLQQEGWLFPYRAVWHAPATNL